MGRPKQLTCTRQQNLKENFPILTDELVSVAGWGGMHCKVADKRLECLLPITYLLVVLLGVFLVFPPPPPKGFSIFGKL